MYKKAVALGKDLGYNVTQELENDLPKPVFKAQKRPLPVRSAKHAPKPVTPPVVPPVIAPKVEPPKVEPEKKKRGRPKGSKNKPKAPTPVVAPVRPVPIKDVVDTTIDNLLSGVNLTQKNRRAVAKEMLKRSNLDHMEVKIEKQNSWGYCLLRSGGDTVDMITYSLNSKDTRPEHYQLKTLFHELTHARAHGTITDAKKALPWEQWLSLEETTAESVAHYMVKRAGITKEIAPSYAKYLVQNLPRLKQLPEFANCKTIADFGKVLAEYRYGAKPSSEWAALQKRMLMTNFNLTEIAGRYKQYINEHRDEIAALIAENTGRASDSVTAYISQQMETVWSSYDASTYSHLPAFWDSLIIAMNRLGVI